MTSTSTAPIFLLHGWGLTPGVWAPLQSALASPTTALSLRAPAGPIDVWANDLSTEIPAGAILVGWSLGALLAMQIAAQAPQRVSRLVLLAATPSFVKRGLWSHGLDPETTSAFRGNFSKDPMRTLERFIALQTLGDSERGLVGNGLRANLDDPAVHASALANGLRLLDETDLRDKLPSPSIRCLLVHGEHDALIPVEATQWLSQRWSASEVFILPGVGHAPQLSQPVALATRIEQFIHAN